MGKMVTEIDVKKSILFYLLCPTIHIAKTVFFSVPQNTKTKPFRVKARMFKNIQNVTLNFNSIVTTRVLNSMDITLEPFIIELN
jgi:hypothetical protein